MIYPDICDKIDGIEIPAAISAVGGSLAFDPVDIAFGLLHLDPMGAAIAGGSVSLFTLRKMCAKMEDKKEKDRKLTEYNNGR